MKYALPLAVIASFTATSTYADKIHQLPSQSIQVSSAHLTTRIEWQKFPHIKINDSDLKDSPRSAVVRIHANTQGKVNHAEIQDSTGLKALDQKIIQAVLNARVKPHIENDIAMPIIGYQVFNLKPSEEHEACQYTFNSQLWQKQQKNPKAQFQYLEQPNLHISTLDLKGSDRKIIYKMKLKHDQIQSIKIIQGSGIYTLDQQFKSDLQGTKVRIKAKASHLWLYKPRQIKDQITFKLTSCS
ncbi:hypothetical protein A3K93_09880 [Acinetobacter sp. NCu2D-2]|uniref:energy transducer TonB n=1 Tax=Acinetobacter sp. NCu2D-2 TaxID=1608473 RepID=UPI0007CE0148|nr:energy transducer TonB [Acinetobacter sp. NCu2D-2]ANF82471.1 hypothetical protein A3K93_09880 [Acinetobacter sp. NCu2D-2]